MKKSSFLGVIALMWLSVSCSDGKKQGQENEEDVSDGKKQEQVDDGVRAEIVAEFESMKKTLPLEIPNTPMTIIDLYFEDDIVVFVSSIPKHALLKPSSETDEIVNSDKNIARILSNMGMDKVEQFIKSGLGIKYIYKDSDSGEVLQTIEMECEKLKEIKEGIEKGDIQPYTALEVFQADIDAVDFPFEAEEGVWVTGAYIQGNTVYYISKVDNYINAEDFPEASRQMIKQGIVEGLKNSLVGAHKKEMAQKGIKLVYIYKDNRGVEFARIVITADDVPAVGIQ